MENKLIARTLKLLSQLMELHDANPFKVRSMSNAARKIDKFPQTISNLNPDELEKIEGIGKSTAGKITELLETGKIAELESYLAETPEGIVELLSIKGLGTKKILSIWKELGIENAGELYYACNENRLVEAKGFGIKTQEEIKKLLEFAMNNQGKFLYPAGAAFAQELEEWLFRQPGVLQLSPAGELRRRSEILTRLEFLVSAEDQEGLVESLSSSDLFPSSENDGQSWTGTTAANMKVIVHFSPREEFAYNLLLGTGHKAHIEKLQQVNPLEEYKTAGSEQEIYRGLGLDYVEPELREGLEEISWSASRQLPPLIEYEDLRGSLHNHTTWSDGIHTLEEMALQCIQNGYDYVGISDHSQSAFYAGGLSEEKVRQQQVEIDLLNNKLAPFRIFKGIESDILFEGGLDYPDNVLATFDFVVASVHSQLKMSEEKATSRLIKAIENPYTTILGHPTGRLLLARQGYPVDHEKVIDACAASGVIIELNANPLRLDLDWRWIQHALSKKVMISINPDAHRKEGLKDMRYGVLAARKGGLTKGSCFNALPVEQAAEWFKIKREKAVR